MKPATPCAAASAVTLVSGVPTSTGCQWSAVVGDRYRTAEPAPFADEGSGVVVDGVLVDAVPDPVSVVLTAAKTKRPQDSSWVTWPVGEFAADQVCPES